MREDETPLRGDSAIVGGGVELDERAVRDTAAGARLTVRVKPRAKRSRIAGVDPSGSVRVDLAAPPVDGKANAALLRFLGRCVLGVAPSRLTLVRGQSSRDKVVSIADMDAATARERIIAAV
ncbi:MAG: hypothetical protein ACI8PZ_007134 [Myxococcota bacterium]